MNKNQQQKQLVPKLRFPEFKNDGEWEEKAIGILFNFKQGVQVSVKNQSLIQKKSMVRFIRIIDITKNDKEPFRFIENPGNEYNVNKQDLFMIRYGTPGVIATGYEGVIANNLFRLIWNYADTFLSKYWYYNFYRIEKKISNLAGSSSMAAINFSTLKNKKIFFPKKIKEQQKIADCLSSLDNLIEVQTQKIEYLKQHKKGLMQGLFP